MSASGDKSARGGRRKAACPALSWLLALALFGAPGVLTLGGCADDGRSGLNLGGLGSDGRFDGLGDTPAAVAGPAASPEAGAQPSAPVTPDPDAPRVYLTFDDGPSPTSTIKILGILAEHGVHATFFVLGQQAEGYPDIVRRVAAEGHTIANHSYSHDYDYVYRSAEVFMGDIERCEAVLTDILGARPPRLLRFPAGSAAVQLDNDPGMRDAIKQSLSAGGWRYFDWNASMGDSWAGGAPEPGQLGRDLIAYIDDMVAEGYTDIVVLAHDTDSRPWTPADLPMVIEHCQAQGYAFCTLGSDSPRCQYR